MIISAISLTENKLKLENFHQAAITRTKIISAELLQNMLKHQIFNEKCLPYFILGFTDKSLRIITGNLLLKTTCDTLTHRIDKYKRIGKDQLRSYYIETFRNTELSPEGNAGLGILDIVFRAGQQVNYRITPFNDEICAMELNIMIHNKVTARQPQQS